MAMKRIPRILVVDDDLWVISSYRHVLEGDVYGRASLACETTQKLEEELFGAPARSAEPNAAWHVDFVDQGENAVEKVRDAVDSGDPYAVVFLDMRMPPGMDGYDTAQLIRSIDPDVHIVIVSGFSDFTEEDLLEIAGPEGRLSFLPKPVWPDQLRAAAADLCQRGQHVTVRPQHDPRRP